MKEFYRLLGFTPEEIKTSYRRLAKQYHPDVNPENLKAKTQFIRLTQVYNFLLYLVESSEGSNDRFADSFGKYANPAVIEVTKEQPSLSKDEQSLKWNSYRNLEKFLKERKFPSAIALVEGLAQRLSKDPEVLQWQAIAYHQWGKELAHKGKIDKAKIYWKKALLSDPYNLSLWSKIEEDCRRLKLVP